LIVIARTRMQNGVVYVVSAATMSVTLPLVANAEVFA